MARGLSGDGQSFNLKSSLDRSVIVLVRSSSGDICWLALKLSRASICAADNVENCNSFCVAREK